LLTVYFGQLFVNYGNSPVYLGYFFPRQKLCFKFGKKRLGLHFGRLFHKRIWSPWLDGGYAAACLSLEAAKNMFSPIYSVALTPTFISARTLGHSLVTTDILSMDGEVW
jgi:hypothetical protein